MDVERIERLAQDLMCRVHDDDPESNGRWWDLLTAEEQRGVAFALACAAPVDKPWSHLIAWTRFERPGVIEQRRRDLDIALRGRAA